MTQTLLTNSSDQSRIPNLGIHFCKDFLWFLFQPDNLEKKLFWTDKKFAFFFNCSNWETSMDQIGENIWWIHYIWWKIRSLRKDVIPLWLASLLSSLMPCSPTGSLIKTTYRRLLKRDLKHWVHFNCILRGKHKWLMLWNVYLSNNTQVKYDPLNFSSEVQT